ncbi:hypothetical protein GCM10012319_09180 [Comamonas sp. KCTC 72670]|nr:hypothetical protein GCM10012319_09180 [Comamonas sp. KCTC 72670]
MDFTRLDPEGDVPQRGDFAPARRVDLADTAKRNHGVPLRWGGGRAAWEGRSFVSGMPHMDCSWETASGERGTARECTRRAARAWTRQGRAGPGDHRFVG